jgi:hypothetical protein
MKYKIIIRFIQVWKGLDGSGGVVEAGIRSLMRLEVMPNHYSAAGERSFRAERQTASRYQRQQQISFVHGVLIAEGMRWVDTDLVDRDGCRSWRMASRLTSAAGCSGAMSSLPPAP